VTTKPNPSYEEYLMTTYYVHESDTPRECPRCDGNGSSARFTCVSCTNGQLGNPEAPRFEVVEHRGCCDSVPGWYVSGIFNGGPFASEPLSVEAARAALRGTR
jgi:hypothetical protein